MIRNHFKGKKIFFSFIFVTFFSLNIVLAALAADPLPDWRDTTTKEAILTYVAAVTNPHSNEYIEPKDRIAVFDNDGTVQLEKPFAFIDAFSCLRVKRLAADHPEWQKDPALKPVIDAQESDLAKLISGYSYEEFRKVFNLGNSEQSMNSLNAALYEYVYTFSHPRFRQPPAKLVYKPMVELIKYLKDNGFIVYFVSGSTTDYLRQFSEDTVGIAKNNVIGCDYNAKLQYDEKGIMSLYKLNELIRPAVVNPGKTITIARYIGRQPVFAAGNSYGDFEMLTYTKQNPKHRSLCLIVAHTDGEREYEYDFGEKVWQAAKSQGWVVVDMKKDFGTVF